ncbi:SBBP repeat-containing protein [Spiroplasma ixodetis]
MVSIPEIKNGIYSITEDNNGNVYCVGKSNMVFKLKKK